MILRYIVIVLALVVVVGALFLWRSGFFSAEIAPNRTSVLRSLVFPTPSALPKIFHAAPSSKPAPEEGASESVTLQQIIETPKDLVLNLSQTVGAESLEREIEQRAASVAGQKQAVSSTPLATPTPVSAPSVTPPPSAPLPHPSLVIPPVSSYPPEFTTYRNLLIQAGMIATTSFQVLANKSDAEAFLGMILDYKVTKREMTPEIASTIKAALRKAYANFPGK